MDGRAYAPARHMGQGFIPRLRFGNTLKGGGASSAPVGGVETMAYLAMVMFVALVGFGRDYFHWSGTHVELALFATFVFGVICGFKVKG
ncbi:hypothetical protein [uncultured Sphingomonas sp.]|uniref:hypothetical protein n=1 Tax=uncultured Sphingomonas sp. TaxID=158754 RepID=UPI0025E01A17|nr:hypothetical protein [uncultured Sphingomonas sp.]